MKEARYGRVITAMVTPFERDGSLDLKGARSLAGYLADNGSEGIVIAGTTGESPTLTHREKLLLFDAVLQEVGDRVHIIAGTGSFDTAESIELTKEAAGIGVHACLIVTPYYSKPPQNGLLAHFRAIADASEVPTIIYDIPGRTARRVERPTMVALAEHERIVAVKEAVGDATETVKLRADLDAAGRDDFEIYSGDDVLLLPHLAAGAIGVVSVCSHLVGPQLRELFDLWSGGDSDGATQLFVKLTPLMNVIMGVTASPIPVKAALDMLGLEVGEPRLPLVPPTSEESATIRSALEAAGLL
ncbi:MAG: 4-hydroxy-tetrahydrodipicolinate synthase [Actinomycetota bacterium]|nr:4-hydroxy-tetrahydrodipicolinate synthase [Actinomycetota bacterium]